MATVLSSFIDFLQLLSNQPHPDYFRLFRELMAHTRNKVDIVFPNMTHAVVGGFVFLRFLCPAIVTPHKFGLVSSNLFYQFLN